MSSGIRDDEVEFCVAVQAPHRDRVRVGPLCLTGERLRNVPSPTPRSTLTVSLPRFAARRSGFPSLFTSPSTQKCADR